MHASQQQYNTTLKQPASLNECSHNSSSVLVWVSLTGVMGRTTELIYATHYLRTAVVST
jgi:hypothetical protein